MGKSQEFLDAARKGDERTVEKIIGQITKRSGQWTTSLRKGPGVNVKDDNGYTPLHHACLHGHKVIVRLLLSADASPCVVDKKGATPLHLAAFKGDSDVVAMLLAHNNPPVNVDQLTTDHETALLIAAHFGYVDVVAQLIAKGADVSIKNNNDESALDLAAQYGRLETVQHLLRVRPQLVEPYKLPQSRSWVFPSTPLHRASKNGRKEVVAALIAAGVDPNIRTHNGTPLHEAACFGKSSVVRMLLSTGADLDAVDSEGRTVLDLLADYSEEATRRVRRVIREFSAEFENMQRNTYESEEDLPPFPVPDYSPTGYQPSNVACDKPDPNVSLLSAKQENILTNSNISNNIIKSSIFTRVLPPSLTLEELQKRKVSDETDSASSVLKPLNIVEVDRSETEEFLSEEFNCIYENHDVQNNNYNNNENIYTNSWHDDYELYQNVSMNVAPKPVLPPKPKMSVPNIMLHLNEELLSRMVKQKSDSLKLRDDVKETTINDIKRGIDEVDADATENKLLKEQNKNLPDDEKAKLSKLVDNTDKSVYTPMDSNNKFCRRKLISDIYGYTSASRVSYIIKQNDRLSDVYVCMDNRKHCPERRSIPNLLRPTINSVHFKGDVGCVHENLDYWYIYTLDPKAVKYGVHPFTKKKEKAEPTTCFCHEIYSESGSKNVIKKNSAQFFSCEDIYVDVHKDNLYSSLSGSELHITEKSYPINIKYKDSLLESHVTFKPFETSTSTSLQNKNPGVEEIPKKMPSMFLKKKFDQFKQLMFDWSG